MEINETVQLNIINESVKIMSDKIDILKAENKKLRDALEEIEGISNEDYKTGGFLTGEIPDNWVDMALLDAKKIAREALKTEVLMDYNRIYQEFYLAFKKAIEKTGDDYKKLSWFNRNKEKP